MPTHVMQTAWLPTRICNKLDRLNRTFLWGGDSTHKKYHLVKWEEVTKPKVDGGLGIREARAANTALLAKLGWKVISNEDTLWRDMFYKKYLKGKDILNCEIKSTHSAQWKGILRSIKKVEPNIRWRVGNGCKISFWYDRWLSDKYLWEMIDGDVHEDDTSLKVSDVLDEDGQWQLDRLKTILPARTQKKIVEFISPLRRTNDDKQIWCGSNSGTFSCKAAYNTIMEENTSPGSSIDNWKWLWTLKCPHKLKIFLWLLSRDRLVTNSLRYVRGGATDSLCIRCSTIDESSLHAIRDCPLSIRIWEKIIVPTQFTTFMSLPRDIWIKSNLSHKFDNLVLPDTPWKTIFLATVWNIWKARNSFVYSGKTENCQEICFFIKRLALDMELGFQKPVMPRERNKLVEKWIAPPSGWYKLNTDGSLWGTTGEPPGKLLAGAF